MGFKMKKMIFGKGTGSAREAAKTHAKTNHVTLSSGPKPYYGGVPGQPGYIDPENPMADQILNPDKVANYVNMPEGTGPGANIYSQYEENVERGIREGRNVPTGKSGRPGSRLTDEELAQHEGYLGIKDSGAGYGDMSLGTQNEQEKAWEEQFRDLESRLENYMGDFHESLNPKDAPSFWPGDKVDNLTLDTRTPQYREQYEEWSKKPGNERRHAEGEQAHKERMNKEIEEVINLDNDLKMAAEVGYHLDPDVMEKHVLDTSDRYAPTQKSEQLKIAHIENEALRKERKGSIKSDKAYQEFTDYMDDGYTATEAAQKIGRTGIDRILGINPGGTYQAGTETVTGNADLFRDALANAKEDDFYPASREWDTERWGVNPNDRSKWNAEQGMSHSDYESQQDVDYQASLIDQQNQEAAAIDAETEKLTSEPTVEIENEKKLEEETSGEEKEEYVPQTQQKEYVPQSQQFKSDDIPQETSILGSESSEDVDQVNEPPPPVDDPSGEPEYGTDEYYAQKKAKRSKMLGLTKRPLNIHGRI